MAEEVSEEIQSKKTCKNFGKGGSPGAVYGLGFVGALVFFLQHATDFGDGVLGILKAIVWPALVSYKLLEFFKF
jgi:hypothetical protein